MFKRLVKEQCQVKQQASLMEQMYDLLKRMKGPLKKLNRDRFSDIHEQQALVRRKLELIQEQLQKNPKDKVLLERE